MFYSEYVTSGTVDQAVNGKCPGKFGTKYQGGKNRLKFLTNSVTFLPGEFKNYRSQIGSYEPHNLWD